MTLSCNQQVIQAFEIGNMTPEEISEDLGFPVVNIKAILMQSSVKYRKACGQESVDSSELNFNHQEQLTIKKELLTLALTTDDDHLKSKLLLNLRDDGMGRKEVKKMIQNGNTFNILQLNDMLQTARSGASKIRSLVTNGQQHSTDIAV